MPTSSNGTDIWILYTRTQGVFAPHHHSVVGLMLHRDMRSEGHRYGVYVVEIIVYDELNVRPPALVAGVRKCSPRSWGVLFVRRLHPGIVQALASVRQATIH